MGGGNAQKFKTDRQRNLEKNKASKGSQLDTNKKAMTIQPPVAPVQKPDELHIYNPSWLQTFLPEQEDMAYEQGMPTMLTWSYGANEVSVQGSWDNWKTRKPLQRSGKDFTLMMVLPSRVYQYRFFVDGTATYAPDLPWTQDETGNYYNVLDLQEHNDTKDRLSKMPDDILVFILSLVDRKDATKTSILSRRWRYMATYFTSLDFDVSRILVDNSSRRQRIIKQGSFLNWVNQVVNLHRAPFINDFRICLPLGESCTHYINIWIKFAISKRVKNLELDLTGGRFFVHSLGYSLPSNVFKGSLCENELSYLTSICLKYVDVKEEVLELLLSQCHLLERLHIEEADNLSIVKIMNLSGKLKYLAIRNCFFLGEVEIHAVNLQSFEFQTCTGKANVVYACVPSLVEASFRWRYVGACIHPKFLQSKCFPTQLSKLSLDMSMIIGEDFSIPSFPCVKYLELRVLVERHRNLLPLMCFAEACPLLHELKLQVIWWCCSFKRDSNELDSEPEFESNLENESDSDDESEECNLDYVKHWLETLEDTNATLPNLRKLTWMGAFSVHEILEFALALYCIKNAINLEKFICDPRPYIFFECGDDTSGIEEFGRRRARKLALVIPCHVEYVIL